MRKMRTTLARQRGALFIVMATVLVLGFAWFVVAAMGKTGVTKADKDARTAAALQAAKRALLGHVAHYAARTDFEFPGRMPCPESRSYPGTLNEGESNGGCTTPVTLFGRLPWKTLGIDQLRDADGEPLWYALSPNFHPVAFPLNPAPPDPYLNFGTPAALPFNDGAGVTNVVAVILAPGRALKSDPCTGFIQEINRYALALEPKKFFECGNATGAYTNPGTATNTNDRVLAITKAEWIEAISGAVADRLQRQVAPALENFRTTESNASWGLQFLPNPSSFSDPTANTLCGADGVREGLMPATASASSSCTSWTNGTVTQLAGLLGTPSCSQAGANYQCTFFNLSLIAPLDARIRARAPNLLGAFRAPITAASITNDRGGTVSNFSLTVDYGNYWVDLDFRITFPLLAVGSLVTVTIPNLPDAAVMGVDGPMGAPVPARWFFRNGWGRYTYFAIGKGSSFTDGRTCSVPGDLDCLTLTNFPAASGFPNDKHFVLALMGSALAAIPQTQPSSNVVDYLESRTVAGGGQPGSPDRFAWERLSSTFNDRFATCPFQVTPPTGLPVPLC
jgi:hypothetical protein